MSPGLVACSLEVSNQILPMKSSPRRVRWRVSNWLVVCFAACSSVWSVAADRELRLSVYCTAGDVLRYLATPEDRQRTFEKLQPLQPSRLFLEGRRGDEHVSAERLHEVRAFFNARNIDCSGGIATVPGANFGLRQTGGLDWLNWESPKVRADVAGFFTENAPVFEELIVDDFFCTGDISQEAERARGGRSWGDYRQDLLVSLIDPTMVQPARRANRKTRLIIKFPQWYDRFHLFGYDPPRMAARFDQVWVGTEVRDPKTRRMGFVQPTQGYMNFRWLSSVAGRKVTGAWFDHIECSAQNFLDQAYASVLAGARELTLFRLGDIMAGHPGDALLAARLPDLRGLAARVGKEEPRGVAFYKPPGGDSSDNLYLADYLGMIGLPVLPVAKYPTRAKTAFLPVQAAADPQLLEKVEKHLQRGATIAVTPALLRRLGPAAAKLAGVEPGATSKPALAGRVQGTGDTIELEVPLDLDGAVRAVACEVRLRALLAEGTVPLLTRRAARPGQLLVINTRTFSEQDFRDVGEWLLPPRPLGLATVPQPVADAIREPFLAALGAHFHAPAGVALMLFGGEACLYSFRDAPARITFGARTFDLPAHGLVWVD